jgi:hypothetical protein
MHVISRISGVRMLSGMRHQVEVGGEYQRRYCITSLEVPRSEEIILLFHALSK